MKSVPHEPEPSTWGTAAVVCGKPPVAVTVVVTVTPPPLAASTNWPGQLAGRVTFTETWPLASVVAVAEEKVTVQPAGPLTWENLTRMAGVTGMLNWSRNVATQVTVEPGAAELGVQLKVELP
jgi:hypothetical protein